MKLNMQNGIAADGVKEPFPKGTMERNARIKKKGNTYDRYPSCFANRKLPKRLNSERYTSKRLLCAGAMK